MLTLSGNNASIRVDGGYLVVSDGPWPVAPDHVGPAAPIEQRMATHRFRRADCPINRIILTRPDGFITFAAIKWLHGVGVGLVQLDWDGTVLLASATAGADQPALRRAQALATGNGVGHAITQDILRAKLNGQAAVARLLGSGEIAELIIDSPGSSVTPQMRGCWVSKSCRCGILVIVGEEDSFRAPGAGAGALAELRPPQLAAWQEEHSQRRYPCKPRPELPIRRSRGEW